MFKRLLGGVASIVLMTGLAAAQTYPPPTTPPEIPPPSMRVPAPGTSRTTVAPSLNGDGWQATTTRRGLDEHDNPVTQRDIYREGIAGGSERHETFTTDPRMGGTTYQSNIPHSPP